MGKKQAWRKRKGVTNDSIADIYTAVAEKIAVYGFPGIEAQRIINHIDQNGPIQHLSRDQTIFAIASTIGKWSVELKTS